MEKTVETLRGLGGALECSCPSEPLKVAPPPASERGKHELCLLDKEVLHARGSPRYLDGKVVRVVAVGSEGARCLSETLGRFGQG